MTKVYVAKGFYPQAYFEKTIEYVACVQSPGGDIAWFDDGITDPWNHVEAAMALSIGNRHKQAEQAYDWLKDWQLDNGGWYVSYKGSKAEDTSRIESNFVAYVATGIWHHYLITKDRDFLRSFWPTVSRAMDFISTLQGEQGQIYWALDCREGIRKDALVTGCSSIYKSLACAINIAEVLNEPAEQLISMRDALGKALTDRPESFDQTWESKQRFAMDWFYPVLTGVIQGKKAVDRINARWDEFVVDQLGCRCVNDEPWVTVAETCELVMSLISIGQYQRAVEVFSWIHQFRKEDGSYWTGYVYPDKAIWPEERTTWTAGAVLLAADALAQITGGHALFANHNKTVLLGRTGFPTGSS